jgi:hypothetical protein
MFFNRAPLEGFTFLRFAIAPNMPKSFVAFTQMTGRPAWVDFSGFEREWAIKDLKNKGLHKIETVGGLVAFIKVIMLAGKKQYLVVAMQSGSEAINSPTKGWRVPISDFDMEALVTRLTSSFELGVFADG